MKSIIQVAVLGAALAWGAWHFSDPSWPPDRLAGLGLSVPAFALWATARIQLGTSFAVRAQAKELVTRGLYSKIRNPIYVFGAIFIAGYFLLIGRPIGLILPAAVAPMQIFRARKEARVLEEKFGDAYREYRSKTWF